QVQQLASLRLELERLDLRVHRAMNPSMIRTMVSDNGAKDTKSAGGWTGRIGGRHELRGERRTPPVGDTGLVTSAAELPSRLIGLEQRVPVSLADLHGPSRGGVVLPVRLAWSRPTEYGAIHSGPP